MRQLVAILTLLLLTQATARADSHFGPPQAPSGFRIEAAVTSLHHPTRLLFGPDGRLYVAQQTGEVIAVTLKDGKETGRDQVARARLHLLGIALKDDKLWVSDTGAIAVYTRTPEGRYENRREIVPKIPHGLHQNDGFAWGPDGKLYWGLGSTTDRGPEAHPWSGAVLRMNPDGTALEVYAKGFRNPYGIAFDPAGRLWVTDNGADKPASSDELNLVEQGADYGFPNVFGMPPAGSPTKPPVALFGEHNSTNGFAIYTGSRFPERYRGQIFAAMWGSSFDDVTGRAVGLVELHNDGKTSKVTPFVTGLNRPLDVTMGPDGDLWVADFVPGIIYRVWYQEPVAEAAVPGSSSGGVAHRLSAVGEVVAATGGWRRWAVVALLALGVVLWKAAGPGPARPAITQQEQAAIFQAIRQQLADGHVQPQDMPKRIIGVQTLGPKRYKVHVEMVQGEGWFEARWDGGKWIIIGVNPG